ncbi:MAG: hypothetical protein GWN61_18405, partial [candidate division Zixibacteria bacterium]|nr:hypothetical protein [candidate division Zixibacteria bacterium]NIS47832.1 hypothetical protein [candidate division Zixibacteria bacterium]NIU15932.1 hypothetical protein [candidate division Zixibacteria bacterium]NIV08092.1 hypothetical protein [candidate division Zixibacteria bacterium]NIW47334.1 hypothetical protein [Gammaproteobacteria bacterium]
QLHMVEEHAWRLPHIEKVEEPTYKQFLNDEINRFDEKNTVFSRNMWDEGHQKLVAEAAEKAPKDDWDILERKAITAGAIYVDAT